MASYIYNLVLVNTIMAKRKKRHLCLVREKKKAAHKLVSREQLNRLENLSHVFALRVSLTLKHR